MSEDSRPANLGTFLVVFDSLGAAQVAQGILESAGVESHLQVVELSLGLPSRVELTVGPDLAHRARWLLSDAGVTDRELDYLATGELDPHDE
jgi:hypothetical protein